LDYHGEFYFRIARIMMRVRSIFPEPDRITLPDAIFLIIHSTGRIFFPENRATKAAALWGCLLLYEVYLADFWLQNQLHELFCHNTSQNSCAKYYWIIWGTIHGNEAILL
jgi:hypothetical protein